MPQHTDQLEQLRQSQQLCRVSTVFDDESPHCGYVIALGDDHVALEVFHDFYSEGACILLLEHVTGITTSDRDRLFDRAIKKEGLRRQLPPAAVLTDFESALRWAHEHRELAIVEIEDLDDEDEDSEFLLGRILSIGDGNAELRYVDSQGHWDDDVVDLELDEITRVQVATPYCELFGRYADPL